VCVTSQSKQKFHLHWYNAGFPGILIETRNIYSTARQYASKIIFQDFDTASAIKHFSEHIDILYHFEFFKK